MAHDGHKPEQEYSAPDKILARRLIFLSIDFAGFNRLLPMQAPLGLLQ